MSAWLEDSDHEEDPEGFLFWIRSTRPDQSERFHFRISVAPSLLWFILVCAAALAIWTIVQKGS